MYSGMNDNAASNYSYVSNEKLVELNQDIGYLLMKYLNGLDVINFMEAINGSKQFGNIEVTEEDVFRKIFMKTLNKEKIQLNIPYLDFYLDHCSIDNQGYLYPTQYHQGEAPVLRTFIHPAFSMDAFKNLCCTYKTASFQCYSRLLSFNTHTYVGYLFLVDYFNTKHLIGCERELNVHERSLFKECLSFRSLQHTNLNEQLSFVESPAEFMKNFDNRFKSSLWIEAIDFKNFHISGGCLVNSLCKQPFSDTNTEKIDINFNGNSFNEFDNAVTNLFAHLKFILSKKIDQTQATLVKKSNGSYDAILPFDVQLQFNFKNVPDETDPVSYVLHSSDLDISQIAFTGSHVVCTFAFLQAIATTSFMCYSMHGAMGKSVCNRIIRYCERGFIFLEPQEFDDGFYSDIMAGIVLEEKKEEVKEIVDDDGDIQIITITYEPHRWPLPNVDPHLLQENFIERIRSEAFD